MAGAEEPRRRTGSFKQRRPSSQYLNPLLMPAQDAGNSFVWPQKERQDNFMYEDDVIEEGKELFQNFVVEQIQRESPQILDDVQIKTPMEYKYPLWKKTGRDLRMLADEFARTKERERVRDQAQGIQMDMTYEQFCFLLEELFQEDGITSERIVVLFYFCSDVAIRFLKTGVEMFKRFIDWSLLFIIDRVCSWVQRQGGWSQVLKSPFNTWRKALIWGSVTALIFFGIRYWRRRM